MTDEKIMKILKDVFNETLGVNKFNLSTEVIQRNILEQQINFTEDVFVARAFKPLKIILELIHKNALNHKKIFLDSF